MVVSRRFTYGDQFTPDKINFVDLLAMCMTEQMDRHALQAAIRAAYFEGHGQDPAQRGENSTKMAMNCLLSLNAYGLIALEDTGRAYKVTALTHELLALQTDPQDVYRHFAIHILTQREGLLLCRLIENIRARGEQVTLEYLGEELNELGIKIPPNSTYISTMKSWLVLVGAMRPNGYHVNWEVVYDLLRVDADVIDDLYALLPEQKFFLLSLVSLGVTQYTPSNKIARHTRSVYKVRLTTKNLVKDILEPLEAIGLIDTQKRTTGRGAKPHDVRLSDKGRTEILKPIIENLAHISELTTTEVDQPFEDVVVQLDADDRHVKGKALEIFAVWIIRLLGLRFTEWRMKSYQSTGGGEVDVMAASDKIVYNRWQIQCKNMKSPVHIDVVAKEVGMTFMTKADVVMVITTSSFTSAAVNYANLVSDNSRYYVILLEREDIERIVADRTLIVDILNYKARRTFARRELGISDLGNELLIDDEQPDSLNDLDDALRQAAQNDDA